MILGEALGEALRWIFAIASLAFLIGCIFVNDMQMRIYFMLLAIYMDNQAESIHRRLQSHK